MCEPVWKETVNSLDGSLSRHTRNLLRLSAQSMALFGTVFPQFLVLRHGRFSIKQFDPRTNSKIPWNDDVPNLSGAKPGLCAGGGTRRIAACLVQLQNHGKHAWSPRHRRSYSLLLFIKRPNQNLAYQSTPAGLQVFIEPPPIQYAPKSRWRFQNTVWIIVINSIGDAD